MNATLVVAGRCCPEKDTLEAFTLGRLGTRMISEVGEHLSSCNECLSVLAEIQRRDADSGIDLQIRKVLQVRGVEGRPEGFATRPVGCVGTQMGPYRLVELIGEGGMGSVYRAETLLFDRPVALKTVKDRFGQTGNRIARFRSEGAALARLAHPNIVRLFHFDEHDGWPFYTMELVEGGSLAARVRNAPLDFVQSARLASTIARALDYAHGQNVIHRDLKPQNVLLDRIGNPKVTDFGLARLLDADDSFTATGTVLGTPSYMAPEQTGDRSAEIGTRTDVYALGAILYTCLTQVPPFQDPDPLTTLAKVRTEEVVRPSVLRKGIPADLEAVCLKCLEKKPSNRYASAAELGDDLERWLAGEPTRARPASFARRGHRWLRRRIGSVATAVTVGTLVAVAALGWSSRSAVPESARLPQERGDDRTLVELRSDFADPSRPITLVAEAGCPVWYRPIIGGDSAKLRVSDDGCFTVSTAGEVVLELLPDSDTDRYRIRAQVRHERAEHHGFAGIYAARRPYSLGENTVHTFCELAYNDVKRPGPAPIHINVQRGTAQSTREVVSDGTPHLFFRLLGEPGRLPHVRTRCDWNGKAFPPSGEESGTWRDLELEVSPERAFGTWSGQPPIAASATDIARQLFWCTINLRKNPATQHPSLDGFEPKYAPRGGLGLCVSHGSASFRRVELIRLPTVP